ncbi:MAG: type II secretion system protein [Planctomycetes bacterium]|nr:type II secretion system protein [Planctomycetota bacterium]
MSKRTVRKTDRRTASRRRAGFTLVEILVAAAILGMVFVVLLEAFAVGLRMLEQSQRVTIAASLAEEIHEMVLTLPLADPEEPSHWGLETGEVLPPDDVDDLDDLVFSPPASSDGSVLSDLSDYAQHVTVTSMSATDFALPVADGTSNVCRVSVSVTHRGLEVSRVSWLVVR